MLFGLFTTAGEIKRKYKKMGGIGIQDPDYVEKEKK